MEFLQLFMILIAIILMIAKPQKENLSFFLVVASWLFMIIWYIGHKSGGLLTIMNL